MTGLATDLILSVAQIVPGVVPAVLAGASDDGAVWLLAAGPAGAVATYWGFYRYYRNTDKSHAFEHDTIIKAQPVAGGEEKVDHISRTRDSDIDGKNGQDFRQRVQRVR